MDHITTFAETFEVADWIFVICLTLSVLVMLYALALVHRSMRLMEGELQSLRADHAVMSEELEIVASVIKSQANINEVESG